MFSMGSCVKQTMAQKTRFRRSCFKLTQDDWYPSYQLAHHHNGVQQPKLVIVSFLQLPFSGEYRVCVWGDDDTGMERDFTDKKEAERCFNTLLTKRHVNKKGLDSLGFGGA